jgi:predicted 2-oxoglutarate/Fe(II)-dependent dioxygenase YbiX
LVKVAHSYDIKTLLSEEEVANLWEVYDQTPVECFRQDYQLFNIEKRQVRSPARQNSCLKALDAYMLKEHGLSCNVHYFLKYAKNSFTRMHCDNVKVVKKTIITFMETSNLIGGHTIVHDLHYDLPPNKDQGIRRTGSSHRNSVVPCVLPDVTGTSLIYDWSTNHGVSKVFEGHRIVLVSWYVENA